MRTNYGSILVVVVVLSILSNGASVVRNFGLKKELREKGARIAELERTNETLSKQLATMRPKTAAAPPQWEVVKGKTFEMRFVRASSIMDVVVDLPLDKGALEIYNRQGPPFVQGDKPATERFGHIAAKLFKISPDICKVSFMNGIIVIERLFTTEWEVLEEPIKTVLEAEFPERDPATGTEANVPVSDAKK